MTAQKPPTIAQKPESTSLSSDTKPEEVASKPTAPRPSIKHHVINPQQETTHSDPVLPGISPSHSCSSSIKNQDSSSLLIASTAKSQVSRGYRYVGLLYVF